jgi:hypothetical protein
MPKQVRLRRGTTAQHATFTGADGEVTFDTDKKCLVVHDGVTAGGKVVTGFLVLVPNNGGVVQHVMGCLSLEGESFDDPVLGIPAGTERYVEIGCRTRIATLTVHTQETEWTAAYAVAGIVTLDLAANDVLQHTLTGNVTFTAILPRGFKRATVLVVGDTVSRNLTWPSPWRWVGSAAPTSLAANKSAILELLIFDDNDASVLAKWSVQP